MIVGEISRTTNSHHTYTLAVCVSHGIVTPPTARVLDVECVIPTEMCVCCDEHMKSYVSVASPNGVPTLLRVMFANELIPLWMSATQGQHIQQICKTNYWGS